jgi:5,5'-dehydrodivanillate O-demethylase
MLTAEENEFLTRVGPGTPAGELLRRYWHPVSIAADLTAENPSKFVRILGEDLVLFQTPAGEAGLLHDRCPHRGVSLSYGRVEERGVACAYHGWLFDTKGNCLETPAEPKESNFCQTVKHRAYPVQKLAGLYWAYFGPLPAPAIPKYDVWARTDGWHWLRALPQLDCNWLQAMENSVDTAHLHILHQELVTDGFKVESTTRGTIDNLVDYGITEFAHGFIKRRVFQDGKLEEHPLLFPRCCARPIGRKSAFPSTTPIPGSFMSLCAGFRGTSPGNGGGAGSITAGRSKTSHGGAPSGHKVPPRRSRCPGLTWPGKRRVRSNNRTAERLGRVGPGVVLVRVKCAA